MKTVTSSTNISSRTVLPLFILCILQLFQASSGRKSALFPFGVKNNDTMVLHEVNEFSLPLPYPIQFAGYEYQEIHLTPYGCLGFTSSIFQYVDWGRTAPENDPPFLAPLYFEAFYVGESASDKDGIYQRMLTSESELLKNLTVIIRESVVGASRFTADMAFVATWENIRDRDHMNEINENTTNTFQLVIVFNKDETYAIFNYDRVNPKKKSFYHAGINAGFHKGWTNVLPGNEADPDLSQLSHLDTGNLEGRFVFRVTEEKPERGGCSALQNQLSVSPNFAGMFGGQMIEVSGPCLQHNMTLQCRFTSKGDIHFNSPATMINHMKAKCVVPRLLFRGNITLAFSTDDGKTDAATTSFHIVLPSLMPTEVETASRPGHNNVWSQRDAAELAITWKPNSLTMDANARVDVNLIGYIETRRRFHYKTLTNLGSNIRNRDGRFSFKPSRHRCSGDDCNFQVGMIEVKLIDTSLANSSQFLTTKILPIGWFVVDKLKRTLGRDWPNKKCEEMKDDHQHHPDWLTSLSKCPCTLGQAIADFGRWIPAVDCNVFSVRTCNYHEDAIHCVRSAETTPTSSGNQCCYREDGSLMYSSDTKHGSTPDKASTFGKHPFGKINHVPELSHWVWDVMPYYYCCLWGSQCDTYMLERPTVNCKSYQLPTTVVIFGDPHIITSYGFGYTMQAIGTYWLLKTTTAYADPLKLQGKFILSNLAKVGGKRFSKLHAISLKNSQGDVIEVRMREPYDSDIRLDVLVNGNYIRFNKEHGFIHVFQNMAVYDNNRNGRQQNFTIITDRGIGIKIFEEHGTMPLILAIPPSYKGKIGGLLGNWSNSNPTGLSFTNGTTVDIYDDIAIQEYINEWKVEPVDSLLHHFVAADEDFKPDNVKSQLIPSDFQKVCGKGHYSDFCKHDYIVSNDTNVALVSKHTIDMYEKLISNQKHAANCGQLEVKYGRFDHANYSHGVTVHVIGCLQGFVLKGHSEYECVKRGDSFEWEPEVHSECVSRHDEMSSVGLIVAIVVGSVIVIFLITVIFCCIRQRLKSKQDKLKKVEDPAEAENMITMKDTRSV